MFDKEKLSSLLEIQKQYKYSRPNESRAGGAIKRLGKAEKMAEKFVASKLQQVLLCEMMIAKRVRMM